MWLDEQKPHLSAMTDTGSGLWMRSDFALLIRSNIRYSVNDIFITRRKSVVSFVRLTKNLSARESIVSLSVRFSLTNEQRSRMYESLFGIPGVSERTAAIGSSSKRKSDSR